MTSTPDTEPTVTRRCNTCGGEMVMPAQIAADADRMGAALVHAECPGNPITERHFEVRCSIVERRLTRDDRGVVVPVDDEEPEVLIEFNAYVRAENLADGMRPLALALGDKWQLAEKQAHVADPRAIAVPKG